jgi:hypothetical protein
MDVNTAATFSKFGIDVKYFKDETILFYSDNTAIVMEGGGCRYYTVKKESDGYHASYVGYSASSDGYDKTVLDHLTTTLDEAFQWMKDNGRLAEALRY